MSEQTCENCRFWWMKPHTPTEGFCHKRAPTLGVYKNEIISGWPKCEHRECCGEWGMTDKAIIAAETSALMRKFKVEQQINELIKARDYDDFDD